LIPAQQPPLPPDRGLDRNSTPYERCYAIHHSRPRRGRRSWLSGLDPVPPHLHGMMSRSRQLALAWFISTFFFLPPLHTLRDNTNRSHGLLPIVFLFFFFWAQSAKPMKKPCALLLTFLLKSARQSKTGRGKKERGNDVVVATVSLVAFCVL